MSDKPMNKKEPVKFPAKTDSSKKKPVNPEEELNKATKKKITLHYDVKMELDYNTFLRFINKYQEYDDDQKLHPNDDESKEAWKGFLDYFKTHKKTLHGADCNLGDDPHFDGGWEVWQVAEKFLDDE
jgi:hypothetical protein